MNTRILLVVGDKFSGFVQGKDAITLSNLRGLLALSIPLLPNQRRTALVPGQGLSDASVRELLQEAAKSPNLAHFDFSLWHDLPERASPALTHKRHAENILVSTPKRLNADCFEMHLLIDEQCELMKDHQSGQHVQGMILIEAARQGMLAVTEQFLMPENDIDYAFVFEALSVRYSHYTFPLGATIEAHITERSIDNPRRLAFAAETLVKQCGQTVSEFTMSFGAMEKSRITKREGMMAVKTQSSYLKQITATMQAYEESLQQVENL